MKNAVFWNVKPIVFLSSVHLLLVTANVLPSSPIYVTLIMKALRSSDTPVLTSATRHNVPLDGILQLQIILLQMLTLAVYIIKKRNKKELRGF
jgi:hypothetical protein